LAININNYDATYLREKVISWFNEVGILESHDREKGEVLYVFNEKRASSFYNNYIQKTSAEEDFRANYNIISLDKLNKLLTTMFSSNGYKICKPISILHKNTKKEANIEDTIFTIAGVQILDDILFGTKLPTFDTEKFFVAQPSIRMSSLKKVGLEKGYFSSFINVSSEIINPTIEDYINDINLWLKFLTTYIDPRDISIRIFDKNIVWSGRPSKAFQVYYYCNNLEIGESTFHYEFNRSDGIKLVFLDSGFGLERLALSIYKGITDLEIISPAYFYNKNFKSIDRIRTLTLLIGSNVLPDNTAAGLKVRHLVNDLATCNEDYIWYELVPYFYNFWSDFTASTLVVSPAKIRSLLTQEYYIQRNKILAKKLGLNMSNQELAIPPYEFVENCIIGKYGKKISREELYFIIKEIES
jgi:hypothetical protein